MKSIDQSLEFFRLKDKTKKVFAYLAQNGISPITSIAHDLGYPKPSVYDAIDELKGSSLVVEYSENRSKEYGIISKVQLKELVQEKMDQLKSSHEVLYSFLETAKSHKNESTKPQIAFYQGDAGIKQAFRDNMWNPRDKESFLIWPIRDMVESLGVDFSIWHSAGRLKHKVHLDVIGVDEDRVVDDLPELELLVHGTDWGAYCETRYMPKGTSWTMGYWIYGDTCLFSTFGTERFAFTVKSKEFTSFMKTIFETMWSVAKK